MILLPRTKCSLKTHTGVYTLDTRSTEKQPGITVDQTLEININAARQASIITRCINRKL